MLPRFNLVLVLFAIFIGFDACSGGSAPGPSIAQNQAALARNLDREDL